MEVFFMLDGLERTKENGYFFASNADLMLKSGIGSHHTLSKVIRTFEVYNFITRSVGSFEGRQATTYTLDMEAVMNWCEAHPIGAVSKRRKSAPIKSAPMMGAVSQKCPDEVNARLEATEKKCAELEAINKALVEALSKCGIEAVEKALIGAGIGAVLEEVAEKCPTEPESKKEITNHSVPEGNYREGNIYTRPDGKKNDEAVETVGSVCDFQKNRVEGIETPKAKVTPEERIKELDNLQLWKMQTPNVNPIEIATELGGILTNEMYESHTYKEAAKVGAYLIKYANDIDTLNQIEERLLSAHREKYHCGHPTLDHLFNERRKALTNQTENKDAGSVADTAEAQTTINDEKTQQGASQRANQGSGDTDTIPHDGEASQANENKDAGSVSAPQMGKLSTQTEKTRQMRPDEAREAMTVDIPTDRMLTKIANLNEAYEAEEDMEARNIMQGKANNVATKMCDRCGELASIECVNWGLAVIPETLNQFGKILGTMAGIYLKVALNTLNRRREELLAA